MIKKLRYFLAFLTVAAILAIGTFAATTTAYVKSGATGTGLSASSPIGSISDAFGLFSADGGTIYIIGEYPITSGTTISEKKFDYTLKAGSGGCISLSANLALAKNTNDNTVTFDLPFKLVGSDTRILFGGFNNVVFGKNFSVSASSGGVLNFYGGMRSGTVEAITELPYSIVVNAGTFNVFSGGNYRDSISAYVGSIAAPISVTINGGSFGQSGSFPKDTNIKNYDTFNVSGMSILADDATLTINGGTFYHPIYIQGRLGTVSGEASAKSKVVKKNKKYYAIDGDINVNITGGTFKGGAFGAHFTQTGYTTVMRGDYTVKITGGTFAAGTTFDATQVKAYSGSSKKATITYPTSKTLTPVRFDYVNGAKKTYTDPIRVVFIGDSITEGYAAADAGVDRLTESYPAKFLKYAEAAGREVIVGNFGVSASGLHPSTKRFYENMLAWPMVSEESAPDYVFIGIGINDAQTIGGTNGAFTTYKSNLQKIISTMGELPDTNKVFVTNALYCVMDIAVTHRAGAVLRPTQKIIAKDFIAKDSSKYFFVDLYGLTLSKALDDSLFRAENGIVYERLHPATAGLDFIGNTLYKAAFGGVLKPSTSYLTNTIYVSDSGTAYGAGTADSPISDLGYAYSKLNLNEDCTIYVVGSISLGINFHTPVSKHGVAFVGFGDNAVINVYGNTLKVGSNVRFSNLTLNAAGGSLNVIGAYHNVEMSSNLKTSGVCSFYAGFHPHSNVSASSNAIHDSVASASSGRDCTIKINGGTWHNFALGNARYTADAPTGTYSGTINATIGSGATVGNSSSKYLGIVGLNYFTGTINVTVNSWGTGTVYEYASTSSAVYSNAKNTGVVNIKIGSGISKKVLYGPIKPSVNYDGSAVTIKWNKKTAADRYRIFRRKVGETAWDGVNRYTKELSYTDKTAVAGTAYEYAVQAQLLIDGEYSYSDSYLVEFTPKKLSVPSVTAKNTVDGVSITASAVSGADGYIFYRSTNGTTFTQIAKTTSATYVDEKAKANTKYYYYSRAYSGASQSKMSEAATTIRLVAINPSVYYKAEVSGVHLMWSDVPNAEKYRIFRRVAGETAWDEVNRYVAESDYIDTTVTIGTTYEYAIQAWVPLGDGYVYGPLSAKSITPKAVNAPTVTAKNTVDGVSITASAVTGADGYIFYRSTNGTTFTQIGKAASTTYVDKTATANTTYYYCVRAYVGTSQSENSLAATTVRLVPLEAIAYYSGADNGVHLEWSDVPNAGKYRIFRRASGESVWDDVSRYTYDTEYVDTDISIGTTYEYSAQAWVTLDGGYVYSPLTVVTITPTTHSVPTLTYKDTSSGIVLVSTAVADVEGYIFYRSTDGESFEEIARTTVNTYTDASRDVGKVYYYRVCASFGEGVSDFSNTVTVSVYAYGEVYSGAEYEMIEARAGGESFAVLAMQFECGTEATIKEIPTGAHTYALYGDFIIQGVEVDNATLTVTLPYANADALIFADEPLVYYGDANCDGEISLIDVVKTLKYLAGDGQDLDVCAANISGDIEISIIDVIMILNHQLNTK